MEVLIITVVSIVILLAILLWINRKSNYWKQKGVINIPGSALFGNMKDVILFRKSILDNFSDMYNNQSCRDAPIVGIHIFHKPALLIRDLELVKRILVKDFNSFADRHTSSDPHSDAIGSYNLFMVRNPLWKELRAKISPIFSTGKMRHLFGLMTEIGASLDSYLFTQITDKNKNSFVKEFKELSASFTTDVIASCVFGVKANSIQNSEAEFRQNGRKIFKFTLSRTIEFSTFFFLPELVPIFKFKLFSKDVSNFMRNSINHVIEERERSGIVRNDLIDVLVSLKQTDESAADFNDKFSMKGDALVAQAASFFSAGFETSSTTMSFSLYHLAINPEIQVKLRKELKSFLIKHDGNLTYDNVSELEYLNMVIMEILRLYPPLPFLDRICTADGNGYSLSPISDFIIPKGMPIYIPIYSIQHDPKYFPDPNQFKPERFSSENKSNLVPYSNIPFGVGPHNCIGERFGILQAKVGLFYILRSHKVTTCEKTQMKMRLDPKAMILQADGGIHLALQRDYLLDN